MLLFRPVLVALWLVSSWAQGQTQLGPTQFSQDLQAVVTQLPKLHVNLFFQISQADFEAAAQRLQADIPNLSAYQFYTRLQMLIALARDGHTYLELSPAGGFVSLPITLQHFTDGYFVIAAPADQPFLNRAQLIAVGATPVDQVVTALDPVISHENEYWFQWLAAQALVNLGVMRGLGILPASGPAMYTFRLDGGGQVSVDLSAAEFDQVRALGSPAGFIPPLDSSTGDYSSAWWPQTKTAYVRIAGFHASDGGQQLASQTLVLLDNNPVDNLILDVRNNGGGDLTMVFPLLAGVTQRLQKLHSNPRFQVFALINGGSYSAATVLPEILKAGVPDFLAPFAPGVGSIPTTVVGEPTGGPPQSHGNPQTFALPASGMLVQYATAYSPPWPGIPELDAIYPDISVPVQSTDYFARHDAILAAVLARGSAPPAASSGNATVVNSASFRTTTGIAPGSFASAFGTFPPGPLTVAVNGEGAQLVAANASQLVFLVPADTTPGPVTLTVQQNGQTVSGGSFQVTSAGPGIFVLAPVSAQPGAVLNSDFSVNSSRAPAARGSVLQIFATGYGPLDGSGQAAAEVWIADLPMQVLYSGPAPGSPGMWQINAQVPEDPTVSGQVPLFVSALGLVSNGVTVWAQP